MVMDTIEFWLNGHEFEQAPGDSQGQGNVVCCSPWHRKELDTTERLNKVKAYLAKMILNYDSETLAFTVCLLHFIFLCSTHCHQLYCL